MKNKLMAWLLLACAVSTLVTGCNRRDQYRDPLTTTAQAETEIETTTAEGEDDEKTSAFPYANMNADEMLQMYKDTSQGNMLSTESAYNTPYYYILPYHNGGKAISKLTGNMMQLCKEFSCNHTSCVYSDWIEDIAIADDCLYMLIGMRLYRVDFLFDQTELIYEWESRSGVETITLVGDNIYTFVNYVEPNTDLISRQAMVIDPETKTGELMDESFRFQVSRILGTSMYYTEQDGSLWEYSMETGNRKCLIDDSYLNREEGEVRFLADRLEVGHVLRLLAQSVSNNRTVFYDLDKGDFCDAPAPEGAIRYVCLEDALYYGIRHNTSDYENDPHYEYYQSQRGHFGGKIWVHESVESEPRMLAYMETDGIPDTINKMSASDGKTMLIEYLTYKDFENVYNPDMSSKDGVEARYALMDLETGAVYKDDSYWE